MIGEANDMDALEAILTRRSTRNYRPDPVEPEKLQKILEAARQAPSGGNNQTNHFLVFGIGKCSKGLWA